jgi:hypothetical protein
MSQANIESIKLESETLADELSQEVSQPSSFPTSAKKENQKSVLLIPI